MKIFNNLFGEKFRSFQYGVIFLPHQKRRIHQNIQIKKDVSQVLQIQVFPFPKRQILDFQIKRVCRQQFQI